MQQVLQLHHMPNGGASVIALTCVAYNYLANLVESM